MAPLSPSEIAYQQAHITEDKGPLVIGISVFLIVLTSFILILRMLARRARSLPYGWDDWLAIGGFIFIVLMCVINIISVHYGLGRHLLATNPADAYKILEAGFFLSLVYALGHWFIKMSILLLYKRIFNTRLKWFKIALFACMAYVTGWALGLTITIVTQCQPLNYFWQQYNVNLDPPAQGKCTINSNAAEISTSALNSVADFLLLVLPVSMLWQLQIKTSHKIALISIFAVGVFACIAGILRLTTTLTAISVNSDSTWNTADVYLWTAVEAAVGLWCACFPIIGPIFSMVNDRFRSTWNSKSGSSGSYSLPKWGSSNRRHPDSQANTIWNRSGASVQSKPEESMIESQVDLEPLSAQNGVLRTNEYSVHTAHNLYM